MIAFISDIHGNFPALQAVMNEIDRLGCDKIFCLGDICGYYCQINECIDLLCARKVHCLLGNHDHYLVSSTSCNSKTVKLCIEFQKKIIVPSHLDWLRTLVPFYDSFPFSMRHAGWNDPLEERISSFTFPPADTFPARYYFSGHSHIPLLQQSPDSLRMYCNPGSVGQPRDGDPRASFAVLHQNGEISLHRVSYNIDVISQAMKQAGLGDWIWKCLYKGTKIGS